LSDYLQAFSARDTKCVANCFAGSAVLELPMVKPNRLVGLAEIETAHNLAFQTLSKATFEINEMLTTGTHAIASGKLTVVCREKDELHTFALACECTATGFSRVSWYLDSRGQRLWSDKAVL
jgi:hypothetical protein